MARGINKRILISDKRGDDWISYLARARRITTAKTSLYQYIKQYTHLLVPSNVSDLEIYQTFCAISVNAADVSAPSGTSAQAIYFEYSLINHMCKSNCGWEQENGRVSVFALEDIEAGAQLGIRYVIPDYCLNVRETRRKKLRDVFGFDCRCFVCLGEEIVGSELWLLDQQKRSLIAPWSREMVEKVMDKGWELLCEGRCADLSPLQVIQMLEPGLKIQKSFLDQRNIILLLTAKTLMSMYAELGEYDKTTECLKSTIGMVGISALIQYGTVRDVITIFSGINSCLLKLGRMKESMELSKVMMQLFPKVPSADVFLDAIMERDKHPKGFNLIETDDNLSREAVEEIEKALNAGALSLPDGVNVENLRTYL